MTLWTFVEAHITNIEMKHYALLKIAVDMHSQFSPIWQIFLPVYHQPSKRASCFISNLENLASTKVHRAIFTGDMLGTWYVLIISNSNFYENYFLKWWTCRYIPTGTYLLRKVDTYSNSYFSTLLSKSLIRKHFCFTHILIIVLTLLEVLKLA